MKIAAPGSATSRAAACLGGAVLLLFRGFSGQEPVHFRDVAQKAGLRSIIVSGGEKKNYVLEVNGSGVCWIDYNNDGYTDLYLVNGSTLEEMQGKRPPDPRRPASARPVPRAREQPPAAGPSSLPDLGTCGGRPLSARASAWISKAATSLPGSGTAERVGAGRRPGPVQIGHGGRRRPGSSLQSFERLAATPACVRA